MPTPVPYVPALQLPHTVLAALDPYVPLPQSAQVVETQKLPTSAKPALHVTAHDVGDSAAPALV
jgi:hypothetical protein